MKNKVISTGIATSAAVLLATGALLAQERVDFKWEPRTSEGTSTRDLIVHQPNQVVAYVTKVNGSTNTIGFGWDNIFIPRPQVASRNPPYGTNDFFFDSIRNEPYRMSNEGLDPRFVIRGTKSIVDADGHDISRGPVTGEGIGAIYDFTPSSLGRMTLDFANVAAFKREGLQQKTSKESLSVAVVPAPEARTNQWRGSFLLYPEFKRGTQGVLAPEVYVSGSGKTNDTVVLYVHDNLDFANGVPVYTNIGGVFAYRDSSWTNAPTQRGYSAKSFPVPEIAPANLTSSPSSLEKKDGK